MSSILIAYDLKTATKATYAAMDETIKTYFATRYKVLNTTWIIDSSLPVAEVAALLSLQLKEEDKLVVVALLNEGESVSYQGFTEKQANWLEKYC